jgi:DNA-binding response OmpR family regulator
VARDGRLATDIELLPKPYRKAELAVRLRAMLDRQAASRQRAVQSGGA